MNLNTLKSRLEEVLPGWVIAFDQQEMLNCKADSVENQKALYIEEYRSGSFEEGRYGNSRRDNLHLYFFWTGDGDEYTAEERENFREELEVTGIRPVINHLKSLYLNTTFTYHIGLPVYDINEVGVSLDIQLTEELC